jgi:hypothetical protein
MSWGGIDASLRFTGESREITSFLILIAGGDELVGFSAFRFGAKNLEMFCCGIPRNFFARFSPLFPFPQKLK